MEYNIRKDEFEEIDNTLLKFLDEKQDVKIMLLMWLDGYKARDAQISTAINLPLQNNKQAV